MALYDLVMSRSLPERTVDAWVSIALCAAFPHSLIWAPTQNMVEANWDFGVSLGDGKLLILEDKGATPVTRQRKKPLDTHRIDVDIDQLSWYCDDVESVTGIPVYYVLPRPPWIGRWTGSSAVPDQAVCRTGSVDGPFPEWVLVIRCDDLRGKMTGRRGIFTDTLPLAGSLSLADFIARAKRCEIGKVITGPGDGTSRAAKEVEPVTQQPREPVQLRAPVQQAASTRQQTSVGSALAVFIPAQDLPSFRSDPA